MLNATSLGRGVQARIIATASSSSATTEVPLASLTLPPAQALRHRRRKLHGARFFCPAIAISTPTDCFSTKYPDTPLPRGLPRSVKIFLVIECPLLPRVRRAM